ncbi:MAG: hypothetical protein OEY96_07110 [Gammaproteobacteria bacterium]|nr:hypothetical protein [Gammaproteobacteria bacterium]
MGQKIGGELRVASCELRVASCELRVNHNRHSGDDQNPSFAVIPDLIRNP